MSRPKHSKHTPSQTLAEPPAAHASPSAADKFRILALATSLPPEELGALLRREGLHHAQLEDWRKEVLAALEGSGTVPSSPQDRRRIQQLERELHRKDKALAEAAALLVLQKKYQGLLEDLQEEASTPPRKER